MNLLQWNPYNQEYVIIIAILHPPTCEFDIIGDYCYNKKDKSKLEFFKYILPQYCLNKCMKLLTGLIYFLFTRSQQENTGKWFILWIICIILRLIFYQRLASNLFTQSRLKYVCALPQFHIPGNIIQTKWSKGQWPLQSVGLYPNSPLPYTGAYTGFSGK